MAATKNEVIKMLTMAYSMEIETVLNYLANSTNRWRSAEESRNLSPQTLRKKSPTLSNWGNG